MTDLIALGSFAYFFNILAITGIIYLLLLIMYKRSSRVIINTAEQPYKPDNTMFKWIFKLSIVAIIWFLVREYNLTEYVSQGWDYIAQFFNWTSVKIGEVWNG